MRWPVALTLAAGCSFEPGTLPTPGLGGEAGVIGVIDGAPDTVPTCPDTYVDTYRWLTTATMTWLAGEQACEADAPGLAHLVVIDDDIERARLAADIAVQPGDAWVGIVRDPGGVAPWPWRYVTGGDATYQPWETSGEPNNLSGIQYVAVLRKTSGYLYDYGIDQQLHALCECDERPATNADYDPTTN